MELEIIAKHIVARSFGFAYRRAAANKWLKNRLP